MEVTIRLLKTSDAYKSYIWRNDKEVFAQTTVTYSHEITLEMELEWIKRVIEKEDEYRCAIEVDGLYVGNIYLTNITHTQAEYHIFIGEKSFWGKGIAYKASRQILNYAFNELHLERVLLEVDSRNSKAIKLYLKLGFEKQAIRDGFIIMELISSKYNAL